MKKSIYIGWDPREKDAWEIARHSMLRYMSESIPVNKLVLQDLIDRGIYKRPISWEFGRMCDTLSARPGYNGEMSTQHANARFFVLQLAKEGWALFCDGDVLFRADVCRALDDLDPRKAVYCVQHEHRPVGVRKMDNQVQTRYERKNWSSFMIFNCDHPAHERAFKYDIFNTFPGRELHAFHWLEDHEIGSLHPKWNYLVGHNSLEQVPDPAMVHFTSGVPDMRGYENCEFAEEWRNELARLSNRVAAE